MTAEAQINEIFCSIQGEGLYVGERQLFVRFAGCNLACQYCDSPQALVNSPAYKVETSPGARKFETHHNPASSEQLLGFLAELDKPAGAAHSLCLTGGEPLLQVDFLKEFLPAARQRLELPVYLETNGVLAGHLAEVIGLVEIIALDIKLPSATGLSSYWKEHQKALEVARRREVFVKVVVTKETSLKEIDEAAALIAGLDAQIPLVIQPVSPHGPARHRPAPEQLLALQATARRKLKTVRVIPQTHKIIGAL